jgi:hypothetical protein
MVHRGEQLRFAAKAVDALVVVGERFGKDLDRDVALEVLIAGGVNLAHSTRTKQIKNPVRADDSSGERLSPFDAHRRLR